jgi:hypothetical protein
MTNFVYHLSDYDLSSFSLKFAGLAGVYLWTNKLNGKCYVGSTNNVRRRLGEYLNPVRLVAELARGESIIYKAMLKHGYKSFTFTILELVVFTEGLIPEEKAKVLEACEQKHLDALKPEYNILTKAGSNAGFKMSDEARAKISAAKKGKTSHRKGKILPVETRERMREGSVMAKKVYMYARDNTLVGTYASITDCANASGISRHRIARNLDTMKVLDNYYFTSKPL